MRIASGGAPAAGSDHNGAASSVAGVVACSYCAAVEYAFCQLRAELERLGTAGNLTTDAHLAVLAMERGYILYSTYTDFARFSGLRWVNPCKEARGS